MWTVEPPAAARRDDPAKLNLTLAARFWREAGLAAGDRLLD
jgi:hypothetical protein